MAYTKLQGRGAINVYPADDIKIPSPASFRFSGVNDSVVTNQLVDSTRDFLAEGVRSNDVVYNTTTGAAALVLEVTATALTLSADIFTATPQDYNIYAYDSFDGPVLYVGTGGNLSIVTTAGDAVVLTNIANGVFIPVMVRSVQATGTTCSDIIAFW
jgi:hypothetical protein